MGNKYSDLWHVNHLTDPRSVVPESVMPGYPFLAKTDLKVPDISADLKVNRMVGVPYTDEQIANAKADMMAQANPDDDNVDDFLDRLYPDSGEEDREPTIRDFDGNPDRVTEMDALVAYLQMLGTLVDFSIYDDKADLR